MSSKLIFLVLPELQLLLTWNWANSCTHRQIQPSPHPTAVLKSRTDPKQTEREPTQTTWATLWTISPTAPSWNGSAISTLTMSRRRTTAGRASSAPLVCSWTRCLLRIMSTDETFNRPENQFRREDYYAEKGYENCHPSNTSQWLKHRSWPQCSSDELLPRLI